MSTLNLEPQPSYDGPPGDHVLGANVAGFTRAAEAMLAMGVI